MKKLTQTFLMLCSLLFLGACAMKPYDYTAYKKSNPHSILVIPPLNTSPDIRGTYSFLSTVSMPLAEAGYYVFPVSMVDQTFKENGLETAGDMNQAPLNKIQEIFGADAVLYITVSEYGSAYRIIGSEVRVTANAKLIDARTAAVLWQGQASASDAEGNNNQNSLAGLLVTAVVKQMIGSIGDQGRPIARMTSQRLFTPHQNGLLYGPRSPKYGTEK